MDITTKKIIVLILLLPLIFFIGFSVYSMLNDNNVYIGNRTNNPSISPSPEPTFETKDILKETIIGKYIFSDSTYTLDLRTQSTITSKLSSNVSDNNRWTLQNDNLTLTIFTYIDESPFSTNSDIEVKTIKNPQLAESLFRIPIRNNYYFYSDSYSIDECGDKHCSNGLVSIPNSEFIEILCESKKQEGLSQCDELVENLEIVNIY